MEALKLEKDELKLQDAMFLEIIMAMNQEMSPSTVEELQQLEEVKRQHSAEKQILTTEAIQELEDLNKELQKEKSVQGPG